MRFSSTPASQSTQDKLLRAAERLMADRGIDNVTFAQIARAAGQRNNSVVPYHYGDRVGLLKAVLARHTEPIGRSRSAMLDIIGADAPLREYVRALVLPIVTEIESGDGGDAYVRIAAQMLGHPDLDIDQLGARHTAATTRLETGLRKASGLSAHQFSMRIDLILTVLYHGLADRSRLLADQSTSPATRRRFVDNLVDVIEAMVQPPTSSSRAHPAAHRDPRSARATLTPT